ncbi:MAG: ABC transporter permease [Schleiferiaceae bacterium]|nr:ABC transporter permease [Schleiferiaceae bacterium]
MSPFDRDVWQEIFATLKKNKLRTGLTGFSVAWGIFMLVILLGAGEGLRNGVSKAFMDDANDAIFISPATTSLPYKGNKPGRRIEFSMDDYEYLKSEFDPKLVSARYWSWNASVNYKNEYGAYTLRGIHVDYIEIERNKVVSGRHLNQRDIDEARKVVVLGRLMAADIFKDKDPIGEYLIVRGVPFRVVGIFSDEGGEREERIFCMPIATAQRLYALGNNIGDLALTPPRQMTLDESKAYASRIAADFARRHQFDPKDLRAISVRNIREQADMILGIISGIQVFVWIIGLGTIVAGIIGVGNIMMIVVKDRTREIGIRKAIGATPWSIISQIILESVFITSFFGYIGLLFGVILLETVGPNMDSDYFANPEINFEIAIITLLILTVAGAIAGYIPARKAAAVQPVEALKSE